MHPIDKLLKCSSGLSDNRDEESYGLCPQGAYSFPARYSLSGKQIIITQIMQSTGKKIPHLVGSGVREGFTEEGTFEVGIDR